VPQIVRPTTSVEKISAFRKQIGKKTNPSSRKSVKHREESLPLEKSLGKS